MDNLGDLICITLFIIAVAMGLGYFASLTDSEHPTLGDVIHFTVKYYGIQTSAIILFIWWAAT